jgi:hypothetical protein
MWMDKRRERDKRWRYDGKEVPQCRDLYARIMRRPVAGAGDSPYAKHDGYYTANQD